MKFTFALIPDQDGSNKPHSHRYIAGSEIKLQLNNKRSNVNGNYRDYAVQQSLSSIEKDRDHSNPSRFRADTARENNPSLAPDIKTLGDFSKIYR